MPRVRWLSLLHRPISFKDRSGLQAQGEERISNAPRHNRRD